MPRHDFFCGVCSSVLVDVYVPVAVRASEGAPFHCGQPTSWIAAAPAVHYGSVKTCAFKAFDSTDGRGQPVHIDSLAKLRQVERESEQAYRNGEGQPVVFRAWSQTRGNKLDSALHKSMDGGEQPTEAGKRKFGSAIRAHAEEPSGTYGPGVSDSNTSALGLGD
jgi:hypothetical protein